jgi:hypothetical protein
MPEETLAAKTRPEGNKTTAERTKAARQNNNFFIAFSPFPDENMLALRFTPSRPEENSRR